MGLKRAALSPFELYCLLCFHFLFHIEKYEINGRFASESHKIKKKLFSHYIIFPINKHLIFIKKRADITTPPIILIVLFSRDRLKTKGYQTLHICVCVEFDAPMFDFTRCEKILEISRSNGRTIFPGDDINLISDIIKINSVQII